METKDTELVFILDRSGSMVGLESDTIGGFNSLLKAQKKEEGVARVTTVLFDHRYTMLHDRVPIREVKPLTEKEYEVGGTTALLDAVGRTIDAFSYDRIAKEQKEVPSVLFVIITDGQENSSSDYTLAQIRTRIEECKESRGWEFIFLGANIDAFQAASSMGIAHNRTASYLADSIGVTVNFKALENSVSSMRSGKGIDDNWKDAVEKDFAGRRKRSTP
ncbi:VWA domain-containing protein [Sphaerochaeta sp. PS]|uniref:vWA domain-containing protein n=1 Tax=Sphaerochaeta sp. PS TaxID=3076336 RepID=UPI0028A34D30|nr:VWA domain-containing protein [Sphaerochaeta sp. PS]MDT4761135.1 VWA domain-containing protein [Sphaerochaeta sp. PS]